MGERADFCSLNASWHRARAHELRSIPKGPAEGASKRSPTFVHHRHKSDRSTAERAPQLDLLRRALHAIGAASASPTSSAESRPLRSTDPFLLGDTSNEKSPDLSPWNTTRRRIVDEPPELEGGFPEPLLPVRTRGRLMQMCTESNRARQLPDDSRANEFVRDGPRRSSTMMMRSLDHKYDKETHRRSLTVSSDSRSSYNADVLEPASPMRYIPHPPHPRHGVDDKMSSAESMLQSSHLDELHPPPHHPEPDSRDDELTALPAPAAAAGLQHEGPPRRPRRRLTKNRPDAGPPGEDRSATFSDYGAVSAEPSETVKKRPRRKLTKRRRSDNASAGHHVTSNTAADEHTAERPVGLSEEDRTVLLKLIAEADWRRRSYLGGSALLALIWLVTFRSYCSSILTWQRD